TPSVRASSWRRPCAGAPSRDASVWPVWRARGATTPSPRSTRRPRASRRVMRRARRRSSPPCLPSGPRRARAAAWRACRGGGTPAFDQRRQPASIQKLVTTAAALRAGHDPDAEIMRMTCNGAQHYAGGTLWCSFPAGPLTGGLKEAFALSCNIAFANLAVELGWPAMVDELRRWGLDRPSGEMPGAGRLLQTGGSERDLAGLGIGLQLTD